MTIHTLVDSVDWKKYFREKASLLQEPEPEYIDPGPTELDLFHQRMQELSLTREASAADSIDNYIFTHSVRSLVPPANMKVNHF